MDEVRAAAVVRAKKERRKRREAKTKARVRAAQLALSAPLLLLSSLSQICPRI